MPAAGIFHAVGERSGLGRRQPWRWWPLSARGHGRRFGDRRGRSRDVGAVEHQLTAPPSRTRSCRPRPSHRCRRCPRRSGPGRHGSWARRVGRCSGGPSSTPVPPTARSSPGWIPQLARTAVVPGTGDPAGLAVGRSGRTRPATVPGVLVQRRLQVGRFRRRVIGVRPVVPQPGRGRRVAHRIQRRHVQRRRVGSRQRSRQAGRRAAPEPRDARRRRPPTAGGVEPGRCGVHRSPGSRPRGRRGRRRQRRTGVGRRTLSPLDLAYALIAAGACGDGARHQPRLGRLQLVRPRGRQRRARQRPLRRHRRRSLPRSRRLRGFVAVFIRGTVVAGDRTSRCGPLATR